MKKFAKSIGKFLFWIIALLSLSALFQEEIKQMGVGVILGTIAVILIAGFTYMIIIKITEFENSLEELEQKFISEKDLNKLRTDINSIKLTLTKNE